MYAFIAYDGRRYVTVEYAAYDTPACELAGRCRELEAERNDGYAVTAWREGMIVADAEGLTEREALISVSAEEYRALLRDVFRIADGE